MDVAIGFGANEPAGSRKTRRPLDVTVLMGGPSSERDVSIMSGTAIAGALERLGHRVTRADISPGDTSALDREGLDLVFIALHGEFGESGEVQRLCQERNLAYTGSPPRASELAMDKAAAKQLFRQASLATPDWNVIEEFHGPELVKAHLKEIPVPVVVKPIDGGSSIGVTIARSEAARDRAVEQALDKYGRVMVEQYVPGRELTVSVLGDDALSVLEVVPAGEFYDYNAKYADDSGTRYVFDHALDAQTVKAVQSAALTAHRCLGCRDMSRVDFILDPSGLLQVLEVNTIPGFTSHSLLPMAAARAGIDFDELVARLVNMAIKRSAVCRNVKQRQNHAR